MTANESFIHHFYESFQKRDVSAMQDCYSDEATFNDPVFTNLNAKQVRSMWAMLLRTGKDLHIDFGNIHGHNDEVTAEWNAHYTFSATGNKVINRIKARFILKNGRIVLHQDDFDFYKWAKQALGMTGLLLGWTGFLKNKIRKTARKNLGNYISSGH